MLLWDCEDLCSIWEPAFSWNRHDNPQLTDFSDLFNVVGQVPRTLEPFAMVAWCVWFRRNKLCYNEPSPPPIKKKIIIIIIKKKNFESVSSLLSGFQHRSHNRLVQSRPINVKWKPPDSGMLKIDFDGGSVHRNE